MKVLFVAYEFPPLNIGGAQRPYKFAKYLPEYGVEPVVVTLDPNDYDKVYPNPKVDDTLLRDSIYKFELQSVQTAHLLLNRSNRVSSFFSIAFNKYKGSEGKYWKKNFLAKTSEILDKGGFNLILVTAPPFSILPLAKELSKKYSLPLVVDMRDAWSLWVTSPYSNYVTFLLSKLKEREILKHASKVIVTSEQTIADFKQLHSGIEDEKFVYIPNGYDETISFENINFFPKEKVKIGYVGSFYYSPEAREAILKPFWKKKGHRILQYVPRREDWLYRSPYFFFKAINEFLKHNPSYKNKAEIHFAGTKPDWLAKMVAEFELENIVFHSGFLNHEEVINFQKSCDFLLLTSSKVLKGQDYSIAGKTFEYFTLEKPILAFVAEGAQRNVLINSGAAVIFNPDESTSNAEQMKNILINGITLNVNTDFMSGFHRRNLTRRLSDVLKDIA